MEKGDDERTWRVDLAAAINTKTIACDRGLLGGHLEDGLLGGHFEDGFTWRGKRA